MTVFRPVLPWRTRPAVSLTVPAVVAAAVFAARFVDRSDFVGYWPAVVGASATFLLFSCTLAGVAAAIEASRMRRSRLDQTPTARSTPQVLLLLLGPCYLAGVLVQLAAIIGLSIGTWGTPGQPPVLLLIAYAAILAMHTALGYTLGRVLPLPAALPIAVIASFVWLGFTGSTSGSVTSPSRPRRRCAELPLVPDHAGARARRTVASSDNPWRHRDSSEPSSLRGP